MHTCMCLCMPPCAHRHVPVHQRAPTSSCTAPHLSAHTKMLIWRPLCTHMHVCKHAQYTHAGVLTHAEAQLHTPAHVNVYVHIPACTCICTRAHRRAYTCGHQVATEHTAVHTCPRVPQHEQAHTPPSVCRLILVCTHRVTCTLCCSQAHRHPRTHKDTSTCMNTCTLQCTVHTQPYAHHAH